MQKNDEQLPRRLLNVAVLTFATAFSACTGDSEERAIPPEWLSAARGATIGDVEKALGEPNDRASAKQFLNWTRPHADGSKILKIICANICAASETPQDVMYLYQPSEGGKPKHVVRLGP